MMLFRQKGGYKAWRNYAVTIILAALTYVVGCSNSQFAGGSGDKIKKQDEVLPDGKNASGNGENNFGDPESANDADQVKKAGSGSDGGGSRNDCDGGAEIDVYNDADRIHEAKPCTGDNQVMINVGEKCPLHMALYTMDDMSSGSQVPGRYVCCGLPSRDILTPVKADRYVERNRSCGSGEIMTGVVDTSGRIYCSAINDDRYELEPAKLICAGKKGGPFGIGAKDCDGSRDFVDKGSLPDNIKQLVIGPLGDDGCVSYPFGSLVTQQGGRQCEDSDAATLIYGDSGEAVKMFP